MFFRNLTLFRFPSSLDLSDLEPQLAECTLKPVTLPACCRELSNSTVGLREVRFRRPICQIGLNIWKHRSAPYVPKPSEPVRNLDRAVLRTKCQVRKPGVREFRPETEPLLNAKPC